MIRQTLLATLLSTAALAGAQAQTVAALVGDDQIAIVDAKAGKVAKTWAISGGPGRVLGIDVRPADGQLYAVYADGTVATVDTSSGKAMVKSKLDMIPAAGTTVTVDFNPVADRLRIIGSDGMNLRANVDDGKVIRDGNLAFAAGDKMAGKTPQVVAGAYTNSMKGAKETALFDIDASGALVKQAPPNDGVLNTVGALGMPAKAVAFDIVSGAEGGNAAWLMAGDTLYKVDLATGASTKAATISGMKGTVRDIAVLPGM
ncbi:DUF4394 domain-containing protein [Xanthobacter tagetidis]|uniref:DUF4394 domain-containing protein n=1 Tax=Xanthobacter tagetidis TaxID=60216 RepID=A0A3L7AF69_9HYPH|nr:DUF4394 domain-containing protein [Xanthobacter tagetidis]MBB6306643.1 hypothetical protein [Xanthobacter tagetidis]RLP79039.1 DUF4394 domain-containing protein [Xanthobacter tagetidis]